MGRQCGQCALLVLSCLAVGVGARGLLQESTVQDRALLVAVADSDAEGVQEALREGAHVDTINSLGSTPLMLAVAMEESEIMRLLLENGADVNLQNIDGFTALHFAAQGGTVLAARILLRKDPDLELVSTGQATPLYIAAQSGHHDIMKLLLEKGAEVDPQFRSGATPLLAAAENGDLKGIKLLSTSGADVQHINVHNVSALHFAAGAVKGSDAVKFLIDKGIDVNIQDEWGDTPLDYAAHFGNEDVVCILLSRGALRNIPDIRETIPFNTICACQRGRDFPGKLRCPTGNCGDEAKERLKLLLDPAETVKEMCRS